MPDEVLQSATGPGYAGSGSGPRVLWSGRCAVAEYAFEKPNSHPRWTLPEATQVLVTDDRITYQDVATGAFGVLHWAWPQYIRVQPGSRNTTRAAEATQIQLVCAGPGAAFPALVLAGGGLITVSDADRLANVMRLAIVRFRVDHADELGVPAPQVRMLSRLLIGPEFTNHQGGEGQTVSLLGSVAVQWPPTPVHDDEALLDPYLAQEPPPASAVSEPTAATVSRSPSLTDAVSPHPPSATADAWPSAGRAGFGDPPPQVPRPGFGPGDLPHPRPADEAALRGTPDLDARAAELAARMANLNSAGSGRDRYETGTTNLSTFLNRRGAVPAQERTEQIRRNG